MEDIYEPLSRYRDEFKDRFSRLTAEMFQELLTRSGVDVSANRKLVLAINKLSSTISKLKNRETMLTLLNVALVIAAVVCLILTFTGFDETVGITEKEILYVTAAVVCGIIFFRWTLPAASRLSLKLADLQTEVRKKKEEAWAQIRPLLDLFEWDMAAKLIQKTYPVIQFDPFFTVQRLTDMQLSYGWDDSFNDDCSVIYSHSGEIRGNPFVFGETKHMYWGMKTYVGRKTIYWTERERDQDGRLRTVRKSETLYASVDKPIPQYANDKFLLYGHEAAPNLSFSRGPSEHSGSENGLFAEWGKKLKAKKLRKFSQNLDDEYDFTMMSNEEFEVLFHAIDRNHEVEFRLLFTALAQQQMLNLLNDRDIGFGDDFFFRKIGMINAILAENQNKINFISPPDQYDDYSVDKIQKLFQTINEEFFKSFYFSLAPLLTIPLYQHSRSTPPEDLSSLKNKASFWEFESSANYYGGRTFEHPDCKTQNILQVVNQSDLKDGSSAATIRAHGFRTEPRVDYVEVYGGDGRFHSVAVEWLEYLPVSKDTQLLMIKEDAENVNTVLAWWNEHYKQLIHYRKFFTCIVE